MNRHDRPPRSRPGLRPAARGGFNPPVPSPPSPADDPPPEPRRPAVAVAAALAGGVALDRALAPPIVLPALLGAACLLIAWRLPAWRRVGALGLLAAAGAANHHLHWFFLPPADLARRVAVEAGEDGRFLARVAGTLAGDPRGYERFDRPAWEDPRRTVFDLRVEALVGDAGPVPTTGTVRVYAAGVGEGPAGGRPGGGSRLARTGAGAAETRASGTAGRTCGGRASAAR